ncbi:putative dehydrogenase [Sporomusaceae bacterium BoRhaA]|uniref:Gfo/Idh/MocA family protein n=1 Tax=Pelorhabdus rhamnosifermentans TaxID=2772457 RepID=UPI001C064500|nr:Gfo/Idh/MocA family oxidoreductase [Pelorhabdus rhamnosifermentans]MBU2699176.1 putative dehydrogenase [Pelorhabdus rhamnosifermentans]
MKKLSVAIIGAGQIAGGYDQQKINGDQGIYTHAGAYMAHGGYELTSICDVNQDQAAQFQKYWKVEHKVTDIDKLLESYHDVVSVCTPDATHYELVKRLLLSHCCKTVFVEKPLALNLQEIAELLELANANQCHIVVDFQRQYEIYHKQIRSQLAQAMESVLTVNAYYIKGLEHIGVTMIDTLVFLFGLPEAVLTYNRVYNQEIRDYTYEFIFYYSQFNVTVKTVDSEAYHYNYHIFEIDMLLTDQRIVINDNSRQILVRTVTDYAYSGVKVLNDREPLVNDTKYQYSLIDAVDYISQITNSQRNHDVSTPVQSFNTKLLIDAIVKSYINHQKVCLEEKKWKR